MTPELPQRPYCIDGPSKSLPASVNAAHLASQSTATYQKAAVSELTQFDGASSEQVAKSRHDWGDLPVIVLRAENTQKDPDLSKADQNALTNSWWAMHERIAKLSTRGENRLVPATGHMIPSQRPQVVVDAAVSMVVEARKGRAE
ncbi:hypothetical protein [Xanthomonas sp. NCPPB 2632]|uniref:hypothetical protein n=1 Tax=Xanthomonas sp. NCPPB 2632 TaxID=3240912 RepID=UPI0035149210